MSRDSVTLKQLAASLGLSVATVSRALAGHSRISRETRERVADAAQAVGYAPNRTAQSLVTGRGSGFVGLVLQDPGYGREDSYLSEFISGLGAGLVDKGIDLFLAAIPQGQSELSVIRNIVNTRRADGLVLARTSEVDPRVDFLLARNFPFVTHGRVLDDELPYSWIDTDGASAFGEAFDFLYDLGHRRFALVTIEEPMTFRYHRTEGLLRAISAKADPAVNLQIATSPRYDPAARAAMIHDLLTAPQRPSAILALFDGLALTLVKEAAQLGVSVPQDVSIIGFDNIPSTAHTNPGITTFDSQTTESAHELASMLVQRLATPSAPPLSRLLQPRLILRGSHGPAPT